MNYTPIFGLRKPESDDYYNVANNNFNADLIEQLLAERMVKPDNEDEATDGQILVANGDGTYSWVDKLPKSYGVRWNKTQDTYERIGDAVGLSVDTSADPHTSDFDDIFPWSDIKRQVIGVNTHVKIPKFYSKTIKYLATNGDLIFEFWVGKEPTNGMEVNPAFLRNGKEISAVYPGAYEAYNDGGTLKSISGVQPTTDQTIGTFRAQAQANGSGYGLEDLLVASARQLLYLVEYADFNSQSKLGIGITNLDSGTGNHSQNTGHTDSLGDGSGQVTLNTLQNGATGAAATYPVQYRGMENPFGNVFEWKDGFLIKDDGYYIGNDIDNYDDAGTGYDHIIATPTNSDGYADNIEHLNNMKYAFIPNSVNGSSSTYLTDYFYAHDAGEVNVARFGGFWSYGSYAGLFTWGLHHVASFASRSVGARLLFIPEN